MTRTWRGEIYRCPKVGWSARPTIAHYINVNRSIHVPFHRDLAAWHKREGEATVVGRMKLSTAGWSRPCLGWTNTNSRSLTNTNSRFLTNINSRFLTKSNSRFFTNTKSRSIQIHRADFSQLLLPQNFHDLSIWLWYIPGQLLSFGSKNCCLIIAPTKKRQ